MNSLRYDFNLPWRGAVIGAVFYVGLSFFMAHLAKNAAGSFSICLISLSAMFALLALFMMARRVVFPRVLELTDDVILFPHGFPKTRITRISHADIIRMRDGALTAHPSFSMATGKGTFEVGAARFKNIEHYHAVRNFICSKTSILLPEGKSGESVWKTGWSPNPILYWKEPEDYIRYRTHIAVSKPLLLRLARAGWFFARCLGFIFLCWLFFNFSQLPALPDGGFLVLAGFVALFFTSLHWLNATHPAHVGEITVRENGITELSGKQTRNLNYGDCRGWAIVERKFEGYTFLILLLQRPKYVFEVALPDINTRDRLIQIFNGKKIPQLNDLKPSWELKS
jgi:hypothetical protein